MYDQDADSGVLEYLQTVIVMCCVLYATSSSHLPSRSILNMCLCGWVFCVCVCIVEAERATGSCGAASTNNAVAMMCLPTACKNKQTYLFYINSFTNVYSVLLLWIYEIIKKRKKKNKRQKREN